MTEEALYFWLTTVCVKILLYRESPNIANVVIAMTAKMCVGWQKVAIVFKNDCIHSNY